MVERLPEHAHVSKRKFYQHFSSKNDLVEEYLRRIHHPGGMPYEQAIDTADTSSRSGPLAPSIALRAAVSGVHFITPPLRQVPNVNHSVCLMP
jgi:AcrR family transcriptional regulator